jgi:hypothetical protein
MSTDLARAAREPAEPAKPTEPAEPAKPAEPGRPVGRFTRWRPDLIAAGLYLAIALWVCSGLFGDPANRVSSHNPNDQIWFQWLLEHGAYSVRHWTNPLFSMRQNVPLGVNIMANTSILGISLPLSPVTMLFGAATAYWVVLIGGLAGTAYASYHVMSRNLVTSRVAAWLGGAFLGFAPGAIHHANGQPNFSSHFVVPFLVLMAIRVGSTGRPVRDGVLLGLLITYQFFINQEVLLISAVAAVVITLLRLPSTWRNWRRSLTALGAGATVAGALLAYPTWFQFKGPQSFHGLPFEFHHWGEDLAAFVSFSRDTVAGSGAVEQTIGRTEQNTWYGWPLVVLALAAAVLLWRRSAVARTAAITGLIFAVASVGPEVVINGKPRGIQGPWALVSSGEVPVLNLLQPTRLTLVVTGVVGVLVALAWERLRPLAGAGWRRAGWRGAGWRRAGQAAIVLALLPIIPWALPTREATPIPEFITGGYWKQWVPDGYTLLPAPVPNNADGIYTLRWTVAAREEFPIPHGYFLGPDQNGNGWYGPVSRETTFWVNHVAKFGYIEGHDAAHRTTPSNGMIVRMREDLQYWHTAIVVLGPHVHEQELKQLWEGVLGPPFYLYGAYVWDVRYLTGPCGDDCRPPRSP